MGAKTSRGLACCPWDRKERSMNWKLIGGEEGPDSLVLSCSKTNPSIDTY